VSDTFKYDFFGAERAHTGSSTDYWQFTGQQLDPQSARNFYYLRARYYDPAIGRFMSRDPMPGQQNQPQSLNQYPEQPDEPG
jgi:RHS repeat-associated protein